MDAIELSGNGVTQLKGTRQSLMIHLTRLINRYRKKLRNMKKGSMAAIGKILIAKTAGLKEPKKLRMTPYEGEL
jgi:vacuolar-type H+-ATPase subunit D/Vma8